jgi:tetratricopeptide (TPR) repeat protein
MSAAGFPGGPPARPARFERWTWLLHPGCVLAWLAARFLGRWAQTARTRGHYTKAEQLFRCALRFAERGLEPAEVDFAAFLNNLGVLHKDQGRFDEAEAVYERALAILRRSRGDESLEVASLYHNLGGLEHARGRWDRGEALATQTWR